MKDQTDRKAYAPMYMAEKKSIRTGGRVTTVRLESPFWDTLREAARGERVSLSTLVTRIDQTFSSSAESAQESRNLASRLRVFCLLYAWERHPLPRPGHAGEENAPSRAAQTCRLIHSISKGTTDAENEIEF